MSVIDIGKLLQEISPEAPSGPNLEYEPAYSELERLAKGKPEQQVGNAIKEAVEPNWRDVKTRALEMLARTRDLRLSMLLAKALVRTDGLAGLHDGLELVRGLVDKFWDTVHPQLDPADSNDPTRRVGIITGLSHPDSMLRMVREALLITEESAHFSVRDVLIATGVLPPAAAGGAPVPEAGAVQAAFMTMDMATLQATTDAVLGAGSSVRAIETGMNGKVGASNAKSLSDLTKLLDTTLRVLQGKLAARGVAVPGREATDEAVVVTPSLSKPITGEVTSREDAIHMLDKITDFFNKNEPSSPVPILLRRAKRLVSKSFMEIVKDLAPGGVSDVERMRGTEE